MTALQTHYAEAAQAALEDTGAAAAVDRIEIRLVGPAERLRAALRSVDGDPSNTERAVATYFDTGDRRLWRRGYSLSVSEMGADRRITLVREEGLGLCRQEWSGPAASAAPDRAALPEDAPQEPFFDLLPGELLPRFQTVMDSASAMHDAAGCRLAVTLERGRIQAVGGATRAAELSVRLADGGLAAMLMAVRSLAAEHGLGLSLVPHARRGMSLASGDAAGAVKARWPVFAPDVTAEQAFADIVSSAAEHIFANLALAESGEDPSGVHQLRVGLRRLRAALSLFKMRIGPAGAMLNDGARQALRRLGAARDLDVFLTGTIPPIAASLPNPDALAPLLKAAETARRKAYGDIRRMLRSPAFVAFQTDLLAAAEAGGVPVDDGGAPLAPDAARLLRRRRRKTLRAGDGFALLPNEERHEARIALKKFRYACGYFQCLFDGPDVRPYRKRMSALQDALGMLNDADVAGRLVDSLAGRNRDAMVAAALVKGWHAHRLSAIEGEMTAAWLDFAEARPFWKGSAPAA